MQYYNVRDILDHYDIYFEESMSSSSLEILCPFHDDKNIGSAKIDENSGLFNCYSCGTGGNIFQFVAMLEDVSIYEAGQLIENDFEPEKKYDIDTLHRRVTKIRIIDESREYQILSKKVALKILYEMSNFEGMLVVDFIYRWLAISNWILDMPIDDVSIKHKQVLDLFTQFLKEKQYYVDQKNTPRST